MSGTHRLVERFPMLGAGELIARYCPPKRFAGVRFSGYLPNLEHPSQLEALEEMKVFAASIVDSASSQHRRGWLRRGSLSHQRVRSARYLDGGYGVGKTHLLASLWHDLDSHGIEAVYLSFAELTAVVGFLGMDEAVASFSRFRMICIDEFELDDVANTLMAVTFLRRVMTTGAWIATTSNSLPERLGEGRFTTDDFTREIAAIASHFETVRIDGPDYRRGKVAPARLATDEQLDGLIGVLGRATAISVDQFDDVLGHLRRVHPVQFAPMLDGLDVVVLKGLHPIANQGDALLFVQLIDELYEAEVTLLASGCPIDDLFPAAYRQGGYRKKYGRCESRLSALVSEAAAS